MHRVANWLVWRQNAISWRSVHSPWLFSMLQTMRSPFLREATIEEARKELHADLNAIDSLDLGAGSQWPSGTVADIARSALKRPRHAQAIAGLCKHLGTNQALELGTCLGLTTAYISKNASAVTTIEGNPALEKRARLVWKQLNITNITSLTGNFDDVIPTLNSKQYDVIFIDGNHRGAALKRYIDLLFPQLSEYGVIICDDIHWSADMEQAWEELISEQRWTLKVDFYEWGLLTANPRLAPEFHCIRF